MQRLSLSALHLFTLFITVPVFSVSVSVGTASATDNSDGQQDGCTCFYVRNDFCCQAGQVLCSCRSVCFNGDAFTGVSYAPCRQPPDGSDSLFPDQTTRAVDPLIPIGCMDGRGRSYKAALRLITKDNMQLRTERGRTRRRKRRRGRGKGKGDDEQEDDSWQEGTSAFLFLDDSEGNIAHFVRKSHNLLLLLNQSSSSSSSSSSSASSSPSLNRSHLPLPAQRLVLIRSAAFKRVAGAYGEHGVHARLLDGIVRLLVDSGSVSSAGNSGVLAKGRMDGGMKPADFLDARSTVAMGGVVKFEGSLGNATRNRPVCFANALFSGNLKASAYPGTLPLLPARLHSHLRHTLSPPNHLTPTLNFTPTTNPSSTSSTSPSTSLPRLLYIRRTVGTNNSASSHAARRAFDQSSEAAFQSLLASLPGVAVQVADFARLSFAEQFSLVQGADIIVGLHGAGLTLASAFNHAPSTATAAAAAAATAAIATAAQSDPSPLRPTIPVVVEIQPYKVQHIIFEGMATSAGALYLLHQCHRGPTDQPGDATFAHVSREACRRRLECRDHFVQSRFVELTQRDVASLRRLLEMARDFVTEGVRAAEAVEGLGAADAVAGGNAGTGKGVSGKAVGNERRALHSMKALHAPADTASAEDSPRRGESKARSWGLWGFLMGGRDRGEGTAAQGTQQGAEQAAGAGEGVMADAVGDSERRAQQVGGKTAGHTADALWAGIRHGMQAGGEGGGRESGGNEGGRREGGVAQVPVAAQEAALLVQSAQTPAAAAQTPVAAAQTPVAAAQTARAAEAAQAAQGAQVAWVRGWMERQCGEWMSETDNNCRVEAVRSPHVRPGERCVLAADDC